MNNTKFDFKLEISKESSQPLYMQLYDTLKEKITNYKIPIGTRIPATRKLSLKYNLSIKTFEEAFTKLAQEKYIYRRPSKGTFVSKEWMNKGAAEDMTIGILFYILEEQFSPFMSQVLPEINSNIMNKKYKTLIFSLKESAKEFKELLLTTENQKLSGLIIFAQEITSNELEMLKAINLPTVLVDLSVDMYKMAESWSSVITDHTKGYYDAALYALNKGYKNVFLLAANEEYHITQQQKTGYLNAFEEFKKEFKPEFIRYGFFGKESGYALMKEFLKRKIEFPIAVLAGDDAMALGIMQAVKETNLKIPEDIGIIGCGNVPFAEHIVPSLTTVGVSTKELGEKISISLINLISGIKVDKKIIVPTNLIIRNSC